MIIRTLPASASSGPLQPSTTQRPSPLEASAPLDQLQKCSIEQAGNSSLTQRQSMGI